MFGTIRKHQKWLWFIIVAVMIFGMITWQNQLNRNGNQQRQAGDFGLLDNKPITTAEFRSAQSEISFLYFLNTGEWVDSGTARAGFDLQQQTFFRVLLIRRLQDYNIHVDSDSVAQAANNILREFGRGQVVPLNAFIEQVLTPHGLTAEDFQRFLEHDLARQQLMAVLGLSGQLVAPQEVQSLYVRQHQELAAEAVFFSPSNFLAGIPDPMPASLGQFYTNSQAEYREPDQIQLSYVFFNVTNFMPEAERLLSTNLSANVEDAFRRLGTNSINYGKTPTEAKARIRELLVQQFAMTNSVAPKAIAFHNELISKEPLQAGNLAALAKEKGLEVKVTKPFDKQYRADELNLVQSYPTAALFNLNPEEPFAERPIPGTDGIYIVAFNKMIPSRIPPLDEIHSHVVADYKYNLAMTLAQETGRAFERSATNGLAQGKTFAAICADSKVTAITLPPFSYSTETVPPLENKVDLNMFKNIAFATPVGKVSDFVRTPEGGILVYVRQRLPIDEARMKEQLPEFSKLVRDGREKEAFDLWFSAEASAAFRDNPAYQAAVRERRS